jgi:hypothetical protein
MQYWDSALPRCKNKTVACFKNPDILFSLMFHGIIVNSYVFIILFSMTCDIEN